MAQRRQKSKRRNYQRKNRPADSNESKQLPVHETVLSSPRRSVMTRSMIFTLNEAKESVPASKLGFLSSRQIGVMEASQSAGAINHSARFSSLRIKQVMVWGPSDGVGAVEIRIAGSTNNVSLGDDAYFRAFGTPGSRRAALNILPNRLFREQWFDTADSTLGNANNIVIAGVDTTEGKIDDTVVRVTMELR